MNLNFIYLKTEQKALCHIYFLFLSTLIFRDFIAWLEHSALPEDMWLKECKSTIWNVTYI